MSLLELFASVNGFFGSLESNVPGFKVVVWECHSENIFVVFLDGFQIFSKALCHSGLHGFATLFCPFILKK